MQNNYEIIALGDVQVQSLEEEHLQPISEEICAQIEAIWQDGKKQKNNRLFNGTLPHFISLESDGPGKHVIKVQFVEYKLFYAQQKLVDIDLGIRPLGVSGIIVLKDEAGEHFVFAQRSRSVTEYPSYWELVPSGSLDRECVKPGGEVDFKSKVVSEFEEETGLLRNIVENIAAFAITFDKASNVYDVCCKIEIKNFPASIIKTREYCSFRIVRRSEVRDFIVSCQNHIVPASEAMMNLYLSQDSRKNL